ncbi:S1 RNA-binding domain-containing protein [Patescibacteria group bacterium]|nr:S1 RNA-binding domain-containing protein [Patescibacteria group bacterium]
MAFMATETLKLYRIGDIVEGMVVGTGRSAVYLDLGAQGTGIIYGREFIEEKNALKDIEIGEKLAAKVTDLENEEGYIELSLKEAGRDLTWDTLKEKKESEEMIKVKITGANKGGLLAEINNMQAFLPVSQLSQEHYPKVEDGDSGKILRALQEFVDTEMEVQIFDVDPKEEKIILSERSKERSKIKEILEQYKPGDVVDGEITGIVDFGAFLKFGKEGEEVEGLIHISEIDWQIIDDPSKFLKVGDKVKAKIIDISHGRASLSLKALKEDPWKTAETKYKKFDAVQGRITKLNPFGAFVEIESQIQGLCHISEFGTKTKMEEELTVGKTYPFQILEINATEHRMSLKLQTQQTVSKDVAPAAEPQQPPQAKEETKEEAAEH